MTLDAAFTVGLLAGFCLSGVVVTAALFAAWVYERRC